MIEISTKTVDGAVFISGLKLCEPDTRIGGIGVHYIPEHYLTTELLVALRLLGLKRVGSEPEFLSDCYLYTRGSLPRMVVRSTRLALKFYWMVIRFVYYNCCVFQRIPECQPFSWRYFTLYIWYRRLWHGKTNKVLDI